MLLEGGAHEGGFVQADPNQIFGNFVVDSGLIAQGGVAQQPIQQAAVNPFGGAVSADQLPPPLPPQEANPFGQTQQQQQHGGINMPQQGFGQAIVGNTNNRNPFGV
jgi:hypothetical protein